MTHDPTMEDEIECLLLGVIESLRRAPQKTMKGQELVQIAVPRMDQLILSLRHCANLLRQ